MNKNREYSDNALNRIFEDINRDYPLKYKTDEKLN